MQTFVVVLVSAAVSGTAGTQEKRFSGPQVAEPVTPFRVLEVRDLASREVTLLQRKKPWAAAQKKDATETSATAVEQPGDAALILFCHKVTEPAIGLIMVLEWYTKQHRNLDAHYVLLTNDVTKTERIAKRWASIPLLQKSAFSISLDGPQGPGRYGLNRNVDMTVIVAKKGKVHSNFAILGANTKQDAPKLLAAIAAAIGKPAPAVEQINRELRAERDRRRERNLKQRPLFRLAPNEQLGRLMVAMVYREQRSEADVARVAAAIRKWAGEDAERKKSVRDYSRAILDKQFDLHRYAREQIEKFAERDKDDGK